MSKRMKPLWMPLYVEKFLADTGGLTPSQGGAYIRLLCAMWRSEDGTLPNNDAKLARSAGVGSNNWMRVWPAIKSLFDIDGDRVTSTDLQAELGKANAIIVTKRALASLGGQTTQLRRSFSEKRSAPILTAHKPLKSLNGAQATAQANYNYNIKEKEGGSDEPRPETGSSSPESQTESPFAESQKAFKEKRQPESPSRLDKMWLTVWPPF